MSSIGVQTPTGTLYLPAVGDWTFTYTVQSGSTPLDPAWRLYVRIGSLEWNFVIASDGLSASITILEADLANVFQNQQFWLVLRKTELLTGKVVKS